MRAVRAAVLTVVVVCLAGCAAPADRPSPHPSPSPSPDRSPSGTTSSHPTATAGRPASTASTGTTSRSPGPSRTTRSPASTGPADPRWRFFTDDRTAYRSVWFDGAHRVMIGYGCTRAPYYAVDPRCTDDHGFHHGIDVALPCGTTIRAGLAGTVVDPSRPGAPGPAYGSTAFRIRGRVDGATVDVLIGHADRVVVRPGDRIEAGDPIAYAGARGAPDGCHLHLEQRRPDGGVTTASDPSRLLGLHR